MSRRNPLNALPLARLKDTASSSEVYEPSDDSFLLVDTLLKISGRFCPDWPKFVLEIGSGSGYVITSLALMLSEQTTHLLATDINPTAAECTLKTLQSHNVAERVDVMVMDMCQALIPRLQGAVDLMICNPPYVPTPDEEVGQGGLAAAWAGGFRGRQITDRVLSLAPQLLSPQGELVLVALADNDPQEIMKEMAAVGFLGDVAVQRRADQEVLSVLHFKRR